ncbi:T9SS type A sorting domain-containing protein [Aurantibacillus circumpalustris]|uniref:T9SS type A sorting domain-containing protein n=1 Tax=Aurantibacillus circumpalustris TaxID=3036359 RepID=UPI00295BD44E|nr:glycine-rich protein [Aurantibacillus circumpalustris]
MKRKIYKLLSSAKQGLFALALTVFSGMAYSQATYTFNYTGSTQTVAVQAGSYSIQCWGADGGDGGDGSSANIGSGGKGGYSYGVYTVASSTILYIYVGEKGQSTNTTGAALVTAAGGWNGGGGGFSGSSSSNYKGGGGGGTDVRTTQNTIYSDRVIVAGGGGGGGGGASVGYQGIGGNGGGTSGQDGVLGSSQTAHNGLGGTQSAGGAGGVYSSSTGFPGVFGLGGDGGSVSGNSYPAGGGGGGWYGGGGGATQGGSGAGGSGYIGGLTSGTTAAFGQPGFVPNPDVTGNGRVIITQLCDVSIEASSNPVCEGTSVTLTCTAVTTLSWSSTVSTASTIVVTPTSNATYYVTGIGSNNNCVATAAINISLTPLPDISSMVNPPLLCVGNSATLTASGANTYTWSNLSSGITTAVNPSVTTTYSVSGTNGFGCINNAVIGVNVNTNVITASSNTTICSGESVNVIANGAVSYTWSNGAGLSGFIVSPTVSTVYSVLGTDVFNCALSNSVSITVKALPNVFPSTDKDIICKKESVVLSATGADTYAWSNPITGSSTGASVTLTLSIDIPYLFTVVGTGTNGCSRTATVSVDVQKCAGVNELSEQNTLVSVYPNPNNGLFTVESKQISSGTIEIMDLSGKIIFTETVRGNTTQVNMGDYAAGIYFVKVKNETSFEVIKLIKNQ